jgi:choline monooxygenase
VADLAGLGPRRPRLLGIRVRPHHRHECDYNWKSFIEVYLEDYHVGPFHPGLGNFVTCADLRWEMGREYSVQTVGVARSGSEALGKAGSPVYRAWHEAGAALPAGTPPRHGAVWLTYYPTVMVEWYPNVLVVSTLVPRGPRKTTQHRRVLLSRGDRTPSSASTSRHSRRPTWRPASRTTRSRCAWTPAARPCWPGATNEVGPYQSPMEDGMQHFHEWYRLEMGLERNAA